MDNLQLLNLLPYTQTAKLSSLQQTIAMLYRDKNRECLQFIDTFQISNYRQNPKRTFENSIEYCFNNQTPKMGYDLKIIECFMAMHSFLAFEVRISEKAIQEQTKLQQISEICEDLTPSLQFRDDLIEVMAANMSDAINYCNKSLTYNSDPKILDNWWWDYKNVNSDPQVCNYAVQNIAFQKDYGVISNVGIDIALDSVFGRQCATQLQDLDVFILLTDDQIENICKDLSTQVSNCDSAGWYLVNQYYTLALKDELDFYGDYMIDNYLDTALKNIQTTINKNIVKRGADEEDDIKTTLSLDGVQIPSGVSQSSTNTNDNSSISTNSNNGNNSSSNASQQTAADQLSQQRAELKKINSLNIFNNKNKNIVQNKNDFDGDRDNDDDEEEDEEYSSVPLDIPI